MSTTLGRSSSSTSDHRTGDDRRLGIDSETYLALYLDQVDLPRAMQLTHDQAFTGPDVDDLSFPKYQGIVSGLRLWSRHVDETISQLFDIRSVFPTCGQAAAYHIAALTRNSEGLPQISDAPVIGDEGRVFAITVDRAGVGMRCINCVFRVGRVVAKLFVSQAANVMPEGPRLPEVLEIAERIVSRIRSRDSLDS